MTDIPKGQAAMEIRNLTDEQIAASVDERIAARASAGRANG